MKKPWIVGIVFCLLGLVATGEVLARGGRPGPGRGPGWNQGSGPGWGHGHAWNHGRGRVGVGIVVGAPFWTPWHYPAYYPPVVVERRAPVVYVEQPPPVRIVQSAPQAGYWYFCQAPEGYYPEVQECPEGWVKVPPRP